MKVLLVNPRYRSSFWTFSEAEAITQRAALMPNLALPTLAALTPDDVEVHIVDESVRAVDFDEPCDLVGITGYVTQADRMFELAAEFRRRGRPVVIGGPYASLSTSTVRPHADVLFTGEAELTWPQFIEDFRRGDWKDTYESNAPVDLSHSPTPRMDLVDNDRYFSGAVQTSRGCPFQCEFCDVIVYLGRRQRHKEPEQVVAELESLYRAGYLHAFLSDDNFTANRNAARRILEAVAEWNSLQKIPMSLYTQLSIDIVEPKNAELLALCEEAGLTVAFVGLETPSTEALLSVKKRQNTRGDLVSSVHTMHRSGILIQAGMIVGFDSDTVDIFGRQFTFAQTAGLPLVSPGMLNAPEGTPLEQRLRIERRLDPSPVDDFYVATNIVPLNMSKAELRAGTIWLLNALYEPKAFMERLEVFAADLPESNRLTGASAHDSVRLWGRLRREYELAGPEYSWMPRAGARLFRQKNLGHLVYALTFYHHVVRMLATWSVWDPELAREPEPRFG